MSCQATPLITSSTKLKGSQKGLRQVTEVVTSTENSPVVVQLRPVINLTDDQFFEFCQINRDLCIERTASGKLIIMPPTGTGTGRRNFKLSQQLAKLG